MGKETKKKNKINYQTEEQKEVWKLVITILVVAIVVGIAYLCTRAFVTKDLFSDKNSEAEAVTPGAIDYDVAIVGEILNRPYNEYYVAVYNKTESKYLSDMVSLVYSYQSKESHLHIYTVDLSNKFNEGFYDPENVNVQVEKVNDFKFGDITLLRIKNGKITKAITDLEKMKTELGINK